MDKLDNKLLEINALINSIKWVRVEASKHLETLNDYRKLENIDKELEKIYFKIAFKWRGYLDNLENKLENLLKVV